MLFHGNILVFFHALLERLFQNNSTLLSYSCSNDLVSRKRFLKLREQDRSSRERGMLNLVECRNAVLVKEP